MIAAGPVEVFERCVVVGCGLIGGSFALAARSAGIVRHVVAVDRDAASAARAVELGIADEYVGDAGIAVRAADLVVVATPVAQIPGVLAAIATHLPARALVVDAGSTKRDVVDAARRSMGDVFARFVPSHPIAGREVHGPDAARADLFEGRCVLVTPHEANDAASLDRIGAAWRACGATVETIEVDAHDRVLSAVSHLPHVLAYALVGQIAESPDATLKFALAGSGFRDFTRIAASSPEMWRDIALANRDALVDDLDAFVARVALLRDRIAARDGEAVREAFERASVVRSAWRKDEPSAISVGPVA